MPDFPHVVAILTIVSVLVAAWSFWRAYRLHLAIELHWPGFNRRMGPGRKGGSK